MKNLKVKNELVNTTTNQLSDNYEYLFFQECQLAYNILQEVGAEMKSEEFEKCF